MPYDWNFLVILKYLPKILEGGLHTLALAAASIAVAAPLGIFFGIVRHQRIPFLFPLAVIYIDFFRTSVALVLIYWCYFALPALQASAYMAELVRAGLKSISTGQWEAARALGMPGHVRMRYIILPQAARRMIPLLFLLMIEIVKTTTLAGVVTYPEIVYEAYRVATEIYRPIETFTLVGLICFLFLFTAGRIAIWLEWRFAIVER